MSNDIISSGAARSFAVYSKPVARDHNLWMQRYRANKAWYADYSARMDAPEMREDREATRRQLDAACNAVDLT